MEATSLALSVYVNAIFPAEKLRKIERTDAGFTIDAVVRGESATDLNRQLLSGMRRVEPKTRLRSEWTCCGVTERFFDYTPRGTRKA